jgi:hypothetical protein
VVAFDARGEWCITLHLLTFGAGAAKRDEKTLTASEAADMLDRIRSARLRLDGQLRGLLAGFR